MSAFMHHSSHIGLLVEVAASGRYGAPIKLPDEDYKPRQWETFEERANAYGQLLTDANMTAVQELYGERGDELLKTVTKYRHAYNIPWRIYSPVEVLKAIDSYEYQCDSAAGWADSPARFLVERMRAKMIKRLPGYMEAQTWTINVSAPPAVTPAH